ncbi:unnamed protein product, partial [Discosporangium mesarthrocarpum]
QKKIKCVELGAGVGMVGLYLAGMPNGPRVVLTDVPEVMGILEQNLALNPQVCGLLVNPLVGRASCRSLSWGTDDWRQGDFCDCDLVVLADCVYWEELFDALVDTLAGLVSTGARVLMAHVRRWKRDKKFFRLCAKKMDVRKV